MKYVEFYVFKDTRPEKGERKRIIYVQRLSKVQRRSDLVMKAFEYVHTMHHGQYEYECYTVSDTVEQYQKRFPFVEFFNLTRDEYMRKIQSSHVFLCMSIEEAAPKKSSPKQLNAGFAANTLRNRIPLKHQGFWLSP